MLATSGKMRVTTDSGKELAPLPWGMASYNCTTCPDGAAKGESKGKTVIPKLPKKLPDLLKPAPKPSIPNPTGDPDKVPNH